MYVLNNQNKTVLFSCTSIWFDIHFLRTVKIIFFLITSMILHVTFHIFFSHWAFVTF